MQKTMFKIWDNQLMQYFHDWQRFTEQEAIDCLLSYHDIDYSWQIIKKDEVWNELRDEDWKLIFEDCSIYDFIKTIEKREDKLSYLLDYGDRDTHHCIFWCWDICYWWDYDRGDTLQNFIEWWLGAEDKRVEMEMRFYFDEE